MLFVWLDHVVLAMDHFDPLICDGCLVSLLEDTGDIAGCLGFGFAISLPDAVCVCLGSVDLVVCALSANGGVNDALRVGLGRGWLQFTQVNGVILRC